MTAASWHRTLQPKVTGTWNIHKAIQSREEQLDFFIMTSSKYGSVGHIAQSNYCAANVFLDAFATYRRHLGLPATSLALGMVSEIGIVHDHPEIEESLSRKGVRPLTEEDLLIMFDIAVQHQMQSSKAHTQVPGPEHYDEESYISGHILTGFELTNTSVSNEQFLEANDFKPNDPRARILLKSKPTPDAEKITDSTGSLSERMNHLISLEDHRELLKVIREAISQKTESMLRLPSTQITDKTPLPHLGLDSMLGAELRAWTWRTFGVDLPSFMLLGRDTTLGDIVGHVSDRIIEGNKSD